MFSEVAENTTDINPKFYEDPLRLLVINIDGKISECLKLRHLLVEDIVLVFF